MSCAELLAKISSPDLRNVVLHWDEARCERPMPGWRDIQPSRIAAQLPMIWVYRYDERTDQFTARLAGDRIEEMFGKSFRGVLMTALHPKEHYPLLFAKSKRVTCGPALYHSTGALFPHLDRYGIGERIMMPLSETGVLGDGLMGATVYERSIRPVPPPGPQIESWFEV